MDKEKLLEQVTAALRQSQGPGGLRVRAAPCHQFSRKEYFRFLEDGMSKKEEEKFKEHCQTCLSCSDGLAVAYNELSLAREQNEDELLLARTKTLLADMQAEGIVSIPAAAPGDNFLEVIVEIYGSLLRLIKSTGEVLSWQEAPAFRGQQAKTAEEPIRILKEFENPPMSVQLTLEQLEAGGALAVQVSLLDRQTEAFLTGVPLKLAGPETAAEAVSNDQGEVDFVLPGRGEYLLEALLAGGRFLLLRLSLIRGKKA